MPDPLPPTSSNRDCRIGSTLSLATALVWPLQAVPVALVLSDLLTGQIPAPVLPAVLAFFGLGGLRAVLNAAAQARLTAGADAQIASLRDEILTVETRAAAPSALGGAGAMAALASDKIEMMRPAIQRYRPARLRATVMPLVILALSAWFSWAVALVLMLAGPLIPLFMALVGWAAREASERQLGEIGQFSDILADRLAALSDLMLIGAGGPVINGFAEASDSLRQRTMAVLRIAFLSSTVLELFAALGVAMVAVWVGFSLLGAIGWGSWGAPLTPFAGLYLLLLAPDFFQPLRDVAAAWHDRAWADAVQAELDAWRDEDRPTLPGQGLPAMPMPTTTIRLRGLTLPHGPSLPDTDIAPGEALALIGPSGVGKTTLLRVIAGLERPTAGAVLLGQTPLDEDTADAWRAGIGWMPQAPWFLNRSLRHNIGFGASLRPEVLEQARLAPVLATLPRGDLTPLGERGAGLSGGEARRVTLARALHDGPSVLLADEPTADLDATTAEAVVDGLMDFAASGGTLIAATHDPRLIVRLDRALRLVPAQEDAA